MSLFKKSSEKEKALEDWEKFLVKEPCALDAIFEHLPQGEEDEMGTALVNIFFKHQSAVQIRNAAIAFVKDNFTANELFASPNIALVILGEYVRLFGQDYLKKVLGPTVKSINSGKLRYEIDPNKFTDLDDPRTNFNNLINDAQKIMDDILRNKDKMPVFIKETIIMLHTALNENGTSSPYVTVGRFLFLWFFCPAIINPQRFDLKKGKSKEGQRGLVLVSKLLQSVAREIDTFEKGDFMQNTTEFIHENIKSVRMYSDYILNPDTKSDPKRSYKLKKSSEDYALKVFSFCKDRLNDVIDFVENNYSGEKANTMEDHIFTLCRVLGLDASLAADYGEVWQRVERRMKRVTKGPSVDNNDNSASQSSERTSRSSKKSTLKSLVETSPARLEAYSESSDSQVSNKKSVRTSKTTYKKAPDTQRKKISRQSYDADVMTFDTVSGIDDVFNRSISESVSPNRSRPSLRDEDDDEEVVLPAVKLNKRSKESHSKKAKAKKPSATKKKKKAKPPTSSEDESESESEEANEAEDSEESSSSDEDEDDDDSDDDSESEEESKKPKRKGSNTASIRTERSDDTSTATNVDPDNSYVIKCYKGTKVKLCLIPYGTEYSQFKASLMRKWEIKGKEADKHSLVYKFNECDYALRADTYDIFLNNAMTNTGGQQSAKVWIQ